MPSPVASGTDASARGKPVRVQPSERRMSGFVKTRREPRTSRISSTEGVQISHVDTIELLFMYSSHSLSGTVCLDTIECKFVSQITFCSIVFPLVSN